MSLNRIQKLLFSEYSDFEDMVLVESPFAETTREGRGIRQVQIGLTPTKLVLATDIIKSASDYPVAFFPGCVDAEIECLELISIFPIELVTLSVFRRRRRKVLKAKFHDGNPNHNCKIVYFELGGSDKRKMFWNLWCERVRFLSPEERGNSSLTETSVASSTSASSLHVARTRVSDDKIWQYYAGKENNSSSPVKKGSLRWTDKDLFFGDKMEMISYKVDPLSFSSLIQNDTDEVRTLYRRQRFQASRSSLSSIQSKEYGHSHKRSEHINRFGEGIDEGCKTGLYLPTITCSKGSNSVQSADSLCIKPKIKHSPLTFRRMCDEAIRVWEMSVSETKKSRHPRRYGLMAMSDLHYCFGIYFSGRGDTFSAQMKKMTSVICLKDEKITELEFDKPSDKFQLCNSRSYEAMRPWSRRHLVENKPIYFWTTDCWYRPSSGGSIFKSKTNRNSKVKLYKKTTVCQSHSSSNASSKKSLFIHFGRKFLKAPKLTNYCSDDSLSEYQKNLKMDNLVNVWDIDSCTMAFQLTVIDAQLFLKIPIGELKLLLIQKNGKSSVNLMTWLVFSHRITCLVATEIVQTEDIKSRARLIARFINTAEKCHLLHNYQSCRSLLNGLQCPAVYRLKKTWSQVRGFHATKYEVFEKLSRIYQDPRLPTYQKSFYKSSLEPPYLPSAMHILSTLLNRNIENSVNSSSFVSSFSPDNRGIAYAHGKFPDDSREVVSGEGNKSLAVPQEGKPSQKPSMPKIIKQIFSAFKISPGAKIAKSGGNIKSGGMDHSSLVSRTAILRFGNQGGDAGLDCPVRQTMDDRGEIRNGLESAEAILRNGQKAARKYDLSEDQLAKEFLLKLPYKESFVNYFASFRIEPD